MAKTLLKVVNLLVKTVLTKMTVVNSDLVRELACLNAVEKTLNEDL